MSAYAKDTEVSVERSQAEIQGIVRRYGATGFLAGWEGDRAMVQFTAADRRVRFVLTMPARDERRFTHSSRGARTADVARREWEQACRQIWRAMALVIKAKLEAVQAGIVTFEQEFLAQIVLPDGATVYERTRDALKVAYETGSLQPLLPALPKS